MARVMLCFGYRPVDLQALHTAEDRQGLVLPIAHTLHKPSAGAQQTGYAVGEDVSSQEPCLHVGAPLCSAMCWLSPRKACALRGREGDCLMSLQGC